MDRMRRVLISAVLALSLAGAAAAQPVYRFTETGIDLLSNCRTERPRVGDRYSWEKLINVVACKEFINAVMQTLDFLQTRRSIGNIYCLPENVAFEQLRLTVVNYATGHPQDLHKAALVVLGDALLDAFPCR